MLTLLLAAAAMMPPQAAARGTPVKSETPVRLTATGTFTDGTTRGFHVTADQDSDDDGVPDEMDLRISCTGDHIATAVLSRRDAASGLASGKRVHAPMTRDGKTMAMDDWHTRTVGRRIASSWDLATLKGARAASAAPKPIALVDVAPEVCS